MSLMIQYIRELIEGGKNNDEIISLLKTSNSGLSDDKIHQMINRARDDIKTTPTLDQKTVEQIRRNVLKGHTRDIMVKAGVDPAEYAKYRNVKSAAQSDYVWNAAAQFDTRYLESVVKPDRGNVNKGLGEFYKKSSMLGYQLPESKEATFHHLIRFMKAKKLARGGSLEDVKWPKRHVAYSDRQKQYERIGVTRDQYQKILGIYAGASKSTAGMISAYERYNPVKNVVGPSPAEIQRVNRAFSIEHTERSLPALKDITSKYGERAVKDYGYYHRDKKMMSQKDLLSSTFKSYGPFIGTRTRDPMFNEIGKKFGIVPSGVASFLKYIEYKKQMERAAREYQKSVRSGRIRSVGWADISENMSRAGSRLSYSKPIGSYSLTGNESVQRSIQKLALMRNEQQSIQRINTLRESVPRFATGGTTKLFESYDNLISMIPESEFSHSMKVTNISSAIQEKSGLGGNDLKVASMLHDIYKPVSNDKHGKLAAKYVKSLNKFSPLVPAIIANHSGSGSYNLSGLDKYQKEEARKLIPLIRISDSLSRTDVDMNNIPVSFKKSGKMKLGDLSSLDLTKKKISRIKSSVNSFNKTLGFAFGGWSGINLVKTPAAASALMSTNALNSAIKSHVNNQDLYEKYLFYAPRLKNESNLNWKMKQLGATDEMLNEFSSMRGSAIGRFHTINPNTGRYYFAKGGVSRKEALDFWTGPSYENITRYLTNKNKYIKDYSSGYGNTSITYLDDVIETLRNETSKPLGNVGYDLYTGLSEKKYDLFRRNINKKGFVKFPSFLSLTPSLDTATDFAGSWNVLKITNPTDLYGTRIKEGESFQPVNEFEHLINPGTSFKRSGVPYNVGKYIYHPVSTFANGGYNDYGGLLLTGRERGNANLKNVTESIATVGASRYALRDVVNKYKGISRDPVKRFGRLATSTGKSFVDPTSLPSFITDNSRPSHKYGIMDRLRAHKKDILGYGLEAAGMGGLGMIGSFVSQIPLPFAEGGNIPKTGGKFVGPGSVTSDDIPAMLPRGYVIPGTTIRAMGNGFFNKLTGGKSFATGGKGGLPAMVSNGEYFLGEPTVKAMGGSGWFDSLLSMTRDSNLSPKEASRLGISKFAEGGGIGDALSTFMSYYYNPSQRKEFTTGLDLRVNTRNDPSVLDPMWQSTNQDFTDSFEEILTNKLDQFFKGTITPDDIAKRLIVNRRTRESVDKSGNIVEYVTLQPRFKWSKEDAEKLGMSDAEMRDSVENVIKRTTYTKQNLRSRQMTPGEGIDIGSIRTTEKALMGVNGQLTRLGKLSGGLKDFSFRLASVSMSAMGVYFSTMGLFTSVQQGVTAITQPLKDIEALSQNVGLVKAFGDAIGFGSDQMKEMGINVTDFVNSWKQVSAVGAAVQVMFADLGTKIFGDGRVLTEFTKILQGVFKDLGKPQSIELFKDFLITIVQSIPAAVDALNTMQVAIKLIADQPLAMKAMMWAVAMSMVVQPVVSLGSAMFTLTGMTVSFANKSKNAVTGIQAMTAAMTGLNSRLLASSIYVLALLAAWEGVARLANFVGLKNELAPTQLIPKVAGDIIGGFAEGGMVGGKGDGDDDANIVKLSRGEYVINARAVKRLGKDTLDQLNGYANGGTPFAVTPEGTLDITETRYFGNKNIDLNSTMMKDTANMADVMTSVRQGRDLRVYVTNGSDIIGGGTGQPEQPQTGAGLPFTLGTGPELQDMNIVPRRFSLRMPEEIKIPDIKMLDWLKIPDWLKVPDWLKWPDIKMPDWLKVPEWLKNPDWLKWPDIDTTKITDFGLKSYIDAFGRRDTTKSQEGDLKNAGNLLKSSFTAENIFKMPSIDLNGPKFDFLKAVLYGGGNLGKALPNMGMNMLSGAMPDPAMLLNVMGTGARTKDLNAIITETVNQTVGGALVMGGLGAAHYGGAIAYNAGRTGIASVLGGISRIGVGAGTVGTEMIPALGMMEAGSAWYDYKRNIKTAEQLQQQQGTMGMFTGSMGSTAAGFGMAGDRNTTLLKGQIYENFGGLYDFLNPFGATSTIGTSLNALKNITGVMGGGYDEQGNPKFGFMSGLVDFLSKGVSSKELYAGTAFGLEGMPQVLNNIAGIIAQVFNNNPSNINRRSVQDTNNQVINGMQYVGKTDEIVAAINASQTQTNKQQPVNIYITSNGVNDLESKIRGIMQDYGIVNVMRR